MGDQSTMSMKAKGAVKRVKGAASRAKGAGKNLLKRIGGKMRGMKNAVVKGKLGKGVKGVKNVFSKGLKVGKIGVPMVQKVAKVGMILGRLGRKRRSSDDERRTISRKRRQAIAIGATLLGGYVLNNEWEWIKDELGIGSGTVEKGLVHDVKGNDDHLKILGTHVDSLEKSTMKLRQQVNAGTLDEKMLVRFEQMVGLMEEIKDQYTRIYDSVNMLIAQKRLSTAVVSPPDVYRELIIVAGKLKKDNLELLMEESQEVFEMDASYMLFENMTLSVIVHLPVGRLGESMRLYRFVPTPFRFDNRTNLFMMDPNRESVSYTHLRAHETRHDLVCRLLLEKKK